jgi:hypothetical protein
VEKDGLQELPNFDSFQAFSYLWLGSVRDKDDWQRGFNSANIIYIYKQVEALNASITCDMCVKTI